MIITRQDLEQFEEQMLAPYGIRSGKSRGRAFPEDEPEHRTAFQRDRDRILHTTAFRRLEYKTQVFIITEGDYYRTRLTHTLEVAQIGRSLARALGANEDLVEAICLAHDLGHPPFGHAGEKALSQLMASHGGFDHNRQSMRIITQLENRYPEYPGLNLTWEVREGVVKHETEYDVSDSAAYEPEKRGHLEAQIANTADELAYTAHDLDDGLRSGLLQPHQLEGIMLWETLRRSIDWDGPQLDDLTRHRFIRHLIGLEVKDVIRTTNERISDNDVQSLHDLQTLSFNVIGSSETFKSMNRQLKDFLYQNMYRHHKVFRMQVKAERILEDLFDAYVSDPEILPFEIQHKASKGDHHRVITDYIAGMTDRYALQEHSKLFDPQIQP